MQNVFLTFTLSVSVRSGFGSTLFIYYISVGPEVLCVSFAVHEHCFMNHEWDKIHNEPSVDSCHTHPSPLPMTGEKDMALQTKIMFVFPLVQAISGYYDM